MTADLIAIAGRMGPALANHLWQSTGFAALVWLLTLLLRKDRAQARHWLWFAASVKFLIPFSLLIGLGTYSQRLQPNVSPLGATISFTVSAVGQPFTPYQETISAESRSPGHSRSDWMILSLASIWLLGAAAVVTVWSAWWKRAARTRRRAFPSDSGPEVEALRKVENLMGSRRRIALLRSVEMNEPGIFGIVRPVLLWPERLTERLKRENLEAILAHEMMHVRRQDNLIAAIHMVVESVFWFHPAVWWIGSRMVEEREQACDEAAVQLAKRPEIYAESLLTACRFCVESPLPCISGISGADLKNRIVRILCNPIERKMSIPRKVVLIFMGMVCLGAPVALGMFGAAQEQKQTSTSTEETLPKFEVASIKPHKDDPSSGVMIGVRFTADGVTISGLPLEMLVREAFGVSDDRVLNEPAWTKSARFDIEAKVDAADVKELEKIKMEDRWAMMLPLLEERFGLKFHHETKELQVYTLVVAKGGPKLTESKPAAGDSKDAPKQMMRVSTEGMSMEGADAPMENLARVLSLQLGSTVVDKTGLTGKYDYKLTWVPEQGMPMMAKGPGGGPEPGGGASTPPTGPSLFTALQEQLGLKLESKKEPVDVVVIDQIEQPSPN